MELDLRREVAEVQEEVSVEEAVVEVGWEAPVLELDLAGSVSAPVVVPGYPIREEHPATA